MQMSPKQPNKRWYWFGWLVFLVLIGIVLAVLLRAPSQTGTGQQGKLPDYVLSKDEEQNVREFVQNFVSLYNSYSSGDLSNVKALEDYETPEMQEKSDAWVAQIEGSLPEGYIIRTEADPSTFKYQYPSGARLFVDMQVAVTETKAAGQPAVKRNARASLTLERSGSRWLADSIEFSSP